MDDPVAIARHNSVPEDVDVVRAILLAEYHTVVGRRVFRCPLPDIKFTVSKERQHNDRVRSLCSRDDELVMECEANGGPWSGTSPVTAMGQRHRWSRVTRRARIDPELIMFDPLVTRSNHDQDRRAVLCREHAARTHGLGADPLEPENLNASLPVEPDGLIAGRENEVSRGLYIVDCSRV